MEKKIIIAKLISLSEDVEKISIKASDEFISCAIKASNDKEYSDNFDTAIDIIASVDYKVAEKIRVEAQGFGLMDKVKSGIGGVWNNYKANQYNGLTQKMTNDVNNVLKEFVSDMDTGKLANGMNKVKNAY